MKSPSPPLPSTVRPSTTLILTAVAIMLVVGVIAAIVWWRLADVIFPGTSERTGQFIGRKKGRQPPPIKPKVIAGFDTPPLQPPAPDLAGPSDPIPPSARPPNSPPT